MSKHFIIFSLGIFTAILPATGFPSGWKTFFYVAVGVTVSIISLLLRKETSSLRGILKGKEHTITDSFVQSSHIDTYGKVDKAAIDANVRHIID